MFKTKTFHLHINFLLDENQGFFFVCFFDFGFVFVFVFKIGLISDQDIVLKKIKKNQSV